MKNLLKRLQNLRALIASVMILMIFFVSIVSCTTNHYFSVNADEMTNPKIEYHDSTSVTNPF